MDRPSRLPYTIAILGLLAFVGAAWLGRGNIRSVQPGVQAPDFDANTLEGVAAGIESYRGKVILLNIWATWCPPCVEEMPALQRLEEMVGDEDFVVVAVSVDARLGQTDAMGRPGGDIGAFLREHDLDLEVLHDPSGKIQSAFLTTGVPESFLIDREGVIRRRIVGPATWDTESFKEVVERLLHGEDRAAS